MSTSKIEGVGLLKIANSFPTYVVEEFYVVCFRGQMLPHKFKSYGNAVTYYETLRSLGDKRVGAHLSTILKLPEAQIFDVA